MTGGGGGKEFEKENGSSKGTGAENYTCLSFKYKVRFSKPKTHSTAISPVVWFGTSTSLAFPTLPPNAFFFLRVWCGARFAALMTASATKHRCQEKKKTRQPHGNLLRALLNKVFKYYPKLKDIHTCLKSSPLLPFSLPPFLSLSKHSSRCGLVSMVTICITQPGPLDFSFRCS